MAKRYAFIIALPILALNFREDAAVTKVNIEHLLEGVRSGDPAVRAEATDKLRDLGPLAKEAVPALMEMLLEEKDKDLRECAASILIYVAKGATSVRPQLWRILKDPQEDQEIRIMAAAAIAEMGKDSLPTLCQCLKDPDPFVRQEAAEGFRRIEPAPLDSASKVIEALEDKDGDVRSCASSALRTMGDGVLPALRASLGGLSDRARVDACKVMLDLRPGDDEALATLANGLGHPDVAIRREASHALCNPLGSERENRAKAAAVPALLRTLKDPDEDVRYHSAWALGEIGSKPEKVVPALIEALHDAEEEVRKHAAYALGGFQGQAAPATRDLMRALESDAYDVQLAAIEALERIGPAAREAVALLQKARKSQDAEMRTRARDALRNIGK